MLGISNVNIYQFLKDIISFIYEIGVWVYDNVYLSLSIVIVLILAFLLVKILT